MFHYLRILNTIFLSTLLWVGQIQFAQAEDGNLTLIDNSSDPNESNIEHRETQREANRNYQGLDDGTSAVMKNQTCTQDYMDSQGFDDGDIRQLNLEREQDFLEKFDQCLFNDMAEANNLHSRIEGLNASLEPIGNFSGFGNIAGDDFGTDDLAALQSRGTELQNELDALRTQAGEQCYPSNTSNPSYCQGRAGATASVPDGCDASLYAEIRQKQKEQQNIVTTIAGLEGRLEQNNLTSTGDNNISAANQALHTQGSNTLDALENWEQAKLDYQDAIAAENARRQELNQARARCNAANYFPGSQCYQDLQTAENNYDAAQVHTIAMREEVRRTRNIVNGGNGNQRNAQAGQSDAAAQQGGAMSQNTLNNIQSTAAAYGPFLDKLDEVNSKSNELYDDAMELLAEAKQKSDEMSQFPTDFTLFDMVKTDLTDDSVISPRDKELLISDLSLLGTASAAISNLNCREIGYNKQTGRVDFRTDMVKVRGMWAPVCNNSSAQVGSLQQRMANENSTFKQCYVRSLGLFKAASALYIASEINNKTNFNELANECLMKCVPPEEAASMGIDIEQKDPNCISRRGLASVSEEGVPGYFVNDDSASDDANEQMASLERAANLYGNMVTVAQMKSASKEDALEMFQVAYQAALEEQTAKAERVATAKANLDAARAALRNTNNAIALILAAIAGYTAAKYAYQATCAASPPGAWACPFIAVMQGLIVAALVYLAFLRGLARDSNSEIAYWENELKDAQLHGHMACNYPGISSDYRYMSNNDSYPPGGNSKLPLTAIGLPRTSRGVLSNTPVLEPILGTDEDIFDNEIDLGAGEDLYNTFHGNDQIRSDDGRTLAPGYTAVSEPVLGDTEPLTGRRICWMNCAGLDPTQFDDRSGVDPNTGECIDGQQCNQYSELFDENGNCIADNCDFLEDTMGDWISYSEPKYDFIPKYLNKENIKKYAEFKVEEILYNIQSAGVDEYFESIMPKKSYAEEFVRTDADSTTQGDKDLGRYLGMDGLNDTTDFSYYLAIKMEALKMQTQDNTVDPTIASRLSQVPLNVDHLVEWHDCSNDPNVTNTDNSFGCGPERHLEEFRFRETRSFTQPPPGGYMNELPEKTGFPLPETRGTYLMSVINMLQKNIFLHNMRFGNCFDGGVGQGGASGDTVLDDSKAYGPDGGNDKAPETICGMANRYAQLVRYARRKMDLETTGVDTDLPTIEDRAVGVCLTMSELGNPVPDPVCECRMNNTCVKFQNPNFGNFSESMEAAGSLVTRAANDTLSGDLDGAGSVSAELAKQTNAIRRSIKSTQDQLNKLAKEASKRKNNQSVKSNNNFEDPFDRERERLLVNNGPLPQSRSRSSFGLGDQAGGASGQATLRGGAVKKKKKEEKAKKGNNQADKKVVTIDPKTGKPSFFAGSDLDLDLDGVQLDDGLTLDNAKDLKALRGLEAAERAKKDKIARSFASTGLNLKNKKQPSFGNQVHQNSNLSLFKIISSRYRKTAYPLFMGKKKGLGDR